MTLEDLLEMDVLPVVNWLEENADKFTLQPKPIAVDSAEDIAIKGDNVLVWDGHEWSIDYVDHCAHTGVDYMANDTEVKAYLPLPSQPLNDG